MSGDEYFQFITENPFHIPDDQQFRDEEDEIK